MTDHMGDGGLGFDVEEIPSINKALLAYRVIAYVVGVLLVVLMLVAMPLKYFGGDQWGPLGSTMTMYIGIAHGWLYMALLIAAYNLGRLVKWPWVRLLLIALGGTVPFMSFVAEHFATKDVRARLFAVREAGGWTPKGVTLSRPEGDAGADDSPVTGAFRIDAE